MRGWSGRKRWALIGGLTLVPLLAFILLISALSSGKTPVSSGHAADTPRTSTAPRGPYDLLFDRVRAGIRDKKLDATNIVGGGMDKVVQEVPPDGALLIGFRYSVGDFFGQYITAIRPIFLTRQGERLGTEYGRVQGVMQEIRAGNGYAVGAINVRSVFVVNGFSLTYMRIGPTGLDKNDVQRSDWAGGKAGTEYTLGGSGAPVIGINSRKNNDGGFTGLGAILLQP
jgi:hypothetical protein